MAKYKQCTWCDGTGKQKCSRCHGAGEVAGKVNYSRYYTCSECGGSGEVDCPMCNGQGYTYE